MINLLWRKIRKFEVSKDIESTKMEFYSILIPTILSTEIFNKNDQIKELVKEFEVELSFGDYLFSSRTALLARVIREIEKNNQESLIRNVNIFKEYILNRISERNLIEESETTKFINKYSRNKG